MASLPSALSGQDAATVLKRVDEHYNHLRTLRARFTEQYAGMGMVREESGTLLLAKPGRMRWEYDKPAGKVFVMDGRYGWSYTPGDAQAQRITAKKIDDLRTPLRFLLGHTMLEKELTEVNVAPTSGGFSISGGLRGAGGGKLTLEVGGDGVIRSLRVVGVDGAETSFSFAGMTENEALPAGTFVFRVPEGVGVVEGLPPV